MSERKENRRRHPRFQCAGEAEIRGLTSLLQRKGKIANLSLNGCLLEVSIRHSFHSGEIAEVIFCVRQLSFRMQGIIRQAHSDQVVGVQFTLVTERARRQLLELIDELAEIAEAQEDSPAHP
ncbi:MAG TPA: PilZ domain-containing protein [Acidobacteriaceae bacterium]